MIRIEYKNGEIDEKQVVGAFVKPDRNKILAIESVFADGDDFVYIDNRFVGIPRNLYFGDFNHAQWFGDTAKFIIANFY